MVVVLFAIVTSCDRWFFVLQMFSVGPAFKGIKMIPPGPHFVYYSSSNRLLFGILNICRVFFFWYDPLRQSIECLEVGIFTCREGSEFSPVIGFFVDLSPSEVRAIRLFVYILSWQLARLLSYFDWNSFCCINSISFNVAHWRERNYRYFSWEELSLNECKSLFLSNFVQLGVEGV